MGPLKPLFVWNETHRDLGLLVIRLVVGIDMIVLHGWSKLMGGPTFWAQIGGSMSVFGLSFAPAFWGFMAACGEVFGSLFLLLGLFFRPGLALVGFTMFVATVVHLTMPPGENAGWNGASHALELLAVYVGLFLTGPGRYNLGMKWERE